VTEGGQGGTRGCLCRVSEWVYAECRAAIPPVALGSPRAHEKATGGGGVRPRVALSRAHVAPDSATPAAKMAAWCDPSGDE